MKNFLGRCVFASFVTFLTPFMFSSCAPMQEMGGKPPSKTPDLLSEGRRLFEENCIQCHGRNGDGKGWKAAELKKKPRNFALPFDQWTYSRGDPNKIFEALKQGIPDTPMAMFHFTDEQRWALVYRVMEFSRWEGGTNSNGQ